MGMMTWGICELILYGPSDDSSTVFPFWDQNGTCGVPKRTGVVFVDGSVDLSGSVLSEVTEDGASKANGAKDIN